MKEKHLVNAISVIITHVANGGDDVDEIERSLDSLSSLFSSMKLFVIVMLIPIVYCIGGRSSYLFVDQLSKSRTM